MSTLAELPWISNVAAHRHVLVAGAGGGWDIYCGIPIALALRSLDVEVTLANLTFSNLADVDTRPAEGIVAIDATTRGPTGYFPEGHLARWLAGQGWDATIYALEKTGVAPFIRAYQALQTHVGFDAVVLVDGGTDILMHGDEAGLGTPVEDVSSLLAADALDLPGTAKWVACLGFGIDAFHGVCHAHFLENVAALDRAGAFVGAWSLTQRMREAQAYLAAVEYAVARSPGRESIVNLSVASAVAGEFGNHHRTGRTQGSELFINPLMAQYWAFELPAVAAACLYADAVRDAETVWDVGSRIEAFRRGRQLRKRIVLPM
jgi:hypothetical protein